MIQLHGKVHYFPSCFSEEYVQYELNLLWEGLTVDEKK